MSDLPLLDRYLPTFLSAPRPQAVASKNNSDPAPTACTWSIPHASSHPLQTLPCQVPTHVLRPLCHALCTPRPGVRNPRLSADTHPHAHEPAGHGHARPDALLLLALPTLPLTSGPQPPATAQPQEFTPVRRRQAARPTLRATCRPTDVCILQPHRPGLGTARPGHPDRGPALWLLLPGPARVLAPLRHRDQALQGPPWTGRAG